MKLPDPRIAYFVGLTRALGVNPDTTAMDSFDVERIGDKVFLRWQEFVTPVEVDDDGRVRTIERSTTVTVEAL